MPGDQRDTCGLGLFQQAGRFVVQRFGRKSGAPALEKTPAE
ncbi:hypothetical protein [Mesorhizobium sp. M0676]